MDACKDCALRLFNNKHHNLQGIGNPYFGNCIVIPNVDYDAYKKGDIGFSKQVEIIKNINPSTGWLDSIYIVPFIRCCDKLGCELNDDIYNKCLTYFAQDVSNYNFRNILLLGEAGKKFLHCDITSNFDNLIISKNNRYYNINYSPLIKYIDNDKFEIFKRYIIKWVNWCNTRHSTYKTYTRL